MLKFKILTFMFITCLFTIHADELQPDKNAQSKLTPDAVLKDLMNGNKLFVNNKYKSFKYAARVEKAVSGQYPKAYILSCVDSRVPVETVFNQSIGDIFVGRVAGNTENIDQLGSMEFAAAVAGVKVIMVLGHEACGAVKGACDDVKLGNLTELLENIKPAVMLTDGFEKSQRNSKNKQFVEKVIHNNVEKTIEDIKARSPVLKKLEDDGKLKIVGAYYSLVDGKVSLIK